MKVVSIPAHIIKKWKEDAENSIDAKAVKIGRYMQEHKVDRETAMNAIGIFI